MEKDKNTAWGFSGYLEVLPRKQQSSEAKIKEESHDSHKKSSLTRNRRRWTKPAINPASS
jgi:hypothetical protein